MFFVFFVVVVDIFHTLILKCFKVSKGADETEKVGSCQDYCLMVTVCSVK